MKATLLSILLIAMMAFGSVLTLDGLEWELTGECRDCVVLHLVRPGLVREGAR
ncbi:MAG: hypothetical protein WC997_02320 [Porticoccaceae bacterium]